MCRSLKKQIHYFKKYCADSSEIFSNSVRLNLAALGMRPFAIIYGATPRASLFLCATEILNVFLQSKLEVINGAS